MHTAFASISVAADANRCAAAKDDAWHQVLMHRKIARLKCEEMIAEMNTLHDRGFRDGHCGSWDMLAGSNRGVFAKWKGL